MLSATTIDKVRNSVLQFWRNEVSSEHFAELAQGKEVGHRIADYVDDKTTSFVHAHYPVAFEQNKSGIKKARSMGDLWMQEHKIYHPINIKTGMTNSGQPNMVSLTKLLKNLLYNRIDSYYLLMVKFSTVAEKLQPPEVYFLDMLDYLDYVTFDSGPGQIMLQAESFYADYPPSNSPARTLMDKIELLVKMLEDGDKRLFANRLKRHQAIQQLANEYRKNGVFTVSPDTQRVFNLA